jgi:hypothetical protein
LPLPCYGQGNNPGKFFWNLACMCISVVIWWLRIHTLQGFFLLDKKFLCNAAAAFLSD